MSHTIADIAAACGLVAEGDTGLGVVRPAEPGLAGANDLALAMAPKYEGELRASPARAAVLWPGADWRALGLDAALYAPRARVALAGLTNHFAPPPDLDPGIHESAIVDPSATIGADVWIGPHAIVRPGAVLGDGVRLGPRVHVGAGARIGDGGFLHAGVWIGRDCVLGPRAIVHANAVVGADGFSFVTPERGSVEAAKETGQVDGAAPNRGWRRIASLGRVVAGADVEIGAGSCIDRGTVADTTIGAGTKIDNLVQIGHNARLGETCLICGHVGLAGSVEIGDRVVLGGKVGVGDHIRIGADSVLAGGTLVGANIPAGSVMMGVPAQPRDKVVAQIAALRRLPRLVEQMREVRARLGL